MVRTASQDLIKIEVYMMVESKEWNRKITRCKTEHDINRIVSFFESVFSENDRMENVKKTSEFKKKMMYDNINNENYYIYFIEEDNKIIAGIYYFIIDEIMYLDVLAVDKNYRKKGLTILLINYALNHDNLCINKIIVTPDKYDKDKSFNYYIHIGFQAILCVSCFNNINYEKYNKYNLNIFSNNLETFNDNGVVKYYSTIKYYVDNPTKEYVLYYENTIKECYCYYMFVKNLNLKREK